MNAPVLQPAVQRVHRNTAAILRRWWTEHNITLLRAATAVLALFALLKLSESFWRLLWDPGRFGACDLWHRCHEAHRWFAGTPVYEEKTAIYPPASYALLWPFVGWLEFGAARWLWAFTSGAALVWMTSLLLAGSRAHSRLETALVVLLPLSMNATGVTVGNGQLLLHILAALLAAVMIAVRRRDFGSDLLAALLLLGALVKPTISVPFFWAAICLPGRWRPALLAALGYAALTLFAAGFQPGGVLPLLSKWLQLGLAEAERGGYGNLHIWLAAIGLRHWNVPASAIVLVLLGVWTAWRRSVDPWIILGVTAIVARIWAYHQVYDDVLIVVPMITLFRIAKDRPIDGDTDVLAGVLLVITAATMLVPARLSWPDSPWLPVFATTHTLVWLAVLSFLLYEAEQDRSVARRAVGAPP